jgi:hypothetical protein
MGAGAIVIASCMAISTVLALFSWRDGDPTPWIWISVVSAPLGVLTSLVAWLRRRGGALLAALVVSLLVSALWAFVFISLVFFGSG